MPNAGMLVFLKGVRIGGNSPREWCVLWSWEQCAGGSRLLTLSKFCVAIPIWRRLFVQLIRLAASRAACTAGKSRPTSKPMIAITTNNSTRVKPRRANTDDLLIAFTVLPRLIDLLPPRATATVGNGNSKVDPSIPN